MDLLSLSDVKMGTHEEVVKTYKMLKDANFEVLDMIFEGAMTVKDKEVLQSLETLATKKKAMGVIRVVYAAGENQVRTIEIPVGEPFPEMAEGEQ